MTRDGRPADGHEPGIVVVIGGEILMGREADNNHGFGIEALGFMDGRVTDATVYTVIHSMNEENLHAAFDFLDDILTKEKTSFRLVLPPESLKSNSAGF